VIETNVKLQGNEIELDIFAYTESENMRPLPFKARFVPRSDKIAEMVRAEAKTARVELEKYDGETAVDITKL
jgi:hypothetical protein